MHKGIRKACQQRWEAAWVTGSDVIDGFDEASSEELFPGPVDDESCEVAITDGALGEDFLWWGLGGAWLVATEEPGGECRTGFGVWDGAKRVPHDGVSSGADFCK